MAEGRGSAYQEAMQCLICSVQIAKVVMERKRGRVEDVSEEKRAGFVTDCWGTMEEDRARARSY